MLFVNGQSRQQVVALDGLVINDAFIFAVNKLSLTLVGSIDVGHESTY